MSLFISLSLLLSPSVNSNPEQYPTPRSQSTYIETPRGTGSGVVIANGLVLTAAHVAENYRNKENIIAIEDLSKTTRDLALMRFTEVFCPCAKLAKYEAKVDERVIIIGYPYAVGQILTEGRSQGIYDFTGNPEFSTLGLRLVLTASALPGNSGGGVFVYRDGEWQLVGILVEGVHQSTLTFAVPLQHIKEFLKKYEKSNYRRDNESGS